MTNTSNLPAESLEVEYPLTLLRYELIDGFGGAASRRHGVAPGLSGRARMPVAAGYFAVAVRPLGPGRGIAGRRRRLADKPRHGGVPSAAFHLGHGTLQPGQIVEVITAGSRGDGPPGERAPDAVRRDVAEGGMGAAAADVVYARALDRKART